MFPLWSISLLKCYELGNCILTNSFWIIMAGSSCRFIEWGSSWWRFCRCMNGGQSLDKWHHNWFFVWSWLESRQYIPFSLPAKLSSEAKPRQMGYLLFGPFHEVANQDLSRKQTWQLIKHGQLMLRFYVSGKETHLPLTQFLASLLWGFFAGWFWRGLFLICISSWLEKSCGQMFSVTKMVSAS